MNRLNEKYFCFWAKTSKEQGNEAWHNLLWHLIDTGMVAHALWDSSLSDALKKDMAQALSLDITQTGKLVSFWVALHDIGKAGPAFQRKWDFGKQRIKQAGFTFPPSPEIIPGYHGLATTWIMENYWEEEHIIQDRSFSISLALALGGHHGEFPSSGEMNSTVYRSDHLGDGRWKAARIAIINQLKEIFTPPDIYMPPSGMEPCNALLFLLAGLTTTADWIASNSTYFKFDDGSMPMETYLHKSAEEAQYALQDLGWHGWKSSGDPHTFTQLFPEFIPNSLQSAFIEHTQGLDSPYLLILEAPTGSGKTESALYLADTTIQKEYKAGIYIAMPSQATSNQMYDRTTKFLSERYKHIPLNILLVHGAALIKEDFSKVRIQGIGQDQQQAQGNIIGAEWFLPRKKSLLAPFGIGTVDQTFLSVMRCKHFFLRLFGLAHKVVIFDEVHAYDVYMLEIFKRLLNWLRSVNTSVIILSATLPEQSRFELLQTYTGQVEDVDVPSIEFPRLSISTQNQIQVFPLGVTESRCIALQWLAEEDLTTILSNELASGGNAAIICNRVDHTLEIYERLKEVFPSEELLIFHSRFPYCWREQIETKIKDRYGKNSSSRPQRSIVIATQVIEQSLDLDFDLMISDLAPVDLLIQRAGRLHRHQGNAHPPSRPTALTEPKLMLLLPDQEQDPPSFSKDGSIYAPYILQRTWFAIHSLSLLNLPAQTDELIGKVYSEELMDEIRADLWPQMQEYFRKMLHEDDEDSLKAVNQLIKTPNKRILGSLQAGFDDEHDPASHSLMQTLTRNARPSVQLVCLFQEADGLYTLDQHLLVNLDQQPDHQITVACLRSALSLSNPALVRHFLSQPKPTGWKKSPALRSHLPIIFTNDVYQSDKIDLFLDPIKGLVQQKNHPKEEK
ncbi:MAG: CRISPR-associated helicase Cas3' [Anaerolineaceae bacterium]|nr:CRISPR-associated helicase Cas3' [Anaerolineaceae bacterium]